MALRSSRSRDLAKAVLTVAVTNHYLVTVDESEVKDFSFDDFSDAHQNLIDLENANTNPNLDTTTWETAFELLDHLCFQYHRTHLSK